jgi:hypothetical protein
MIKIVPLLKETSNKPKINGIENADYPNYLWFKISLEAS